MAMARLLLLAGLLLAGGCGAVLTGEYALRNALTGEYLSVAATDGLARAQAQEAADRWYLLHSAALQPQGFLLRHLATGKYLSAASQDDGVLVFGGATPAPEPWMLLPVGNGDGTAFAIWHEHLDRFLSVTDEPDRALDGIGLSTRPGLQSSQWELIGEATCHDAVAGELCYNDTAYAMQDGIHFRPTWYPGLSNASSFGDFQAHLHFCFWRRCPMPCAATHLHRCNMEGRFWPGAMRCEDAAPGTRCHDEVVWAMAEGIVQHPEWYPELSNRSTFREFQARLHTGQEAGLEEHGCAEPCCHDARPGERCHEDVAWAKAVGINSPDFKNGYPAYLSNASSFAEFQAFLHLCYPARCPEPCAWTLALSATIPGGLACPGGRRLDQDILI